jgi:hypothetical protein
VLGHWAGPTLEQRARCRLASSYTADSAREAMDLAYRHGGSTSFKRDSRLAEWWRDLHTVGQTVTLAPEWCPIGGRVYLGLEPRPRPAIATTVRVRARLCRASKLGAQGGHGMSIDDFLRNGAKAPLSIGVEIGLIERGLKHRVCRSWINLGGNSPST